MQFMKVDTQGAVFMCLCLLTILVHLY